MARFVLIIGGGIAAYKALDLLRGLVKRGHKVTPVLTEGGRRFVTELSVSALAGRPCHSDLFALDDGAGMSHINLSREADALIVAPATAGLIARMACGLADDLAAALLLAANKPVLLAPAMNPVMWAQASTQRNVTWLRDNGIHFVEPETGLMACHESGVGRLAGIDSILAAAEALVSPDYKPLAGRRVLITAGPTREPLDPVRFISNHSSGKQGYAIAEAAQAAGAEVILVSGPVSEPVPEGVTLVSVTTADDMQQAVETSLPCDVGIFVAAVADWQLSKPLSQKMKKNHQGPPVLSLKETPDILAGVCRSSKRPALVIGFAAETDDHLANARRKRLAKGCDWLVLNDVSPASGTFGAARNCVTLLHESGEEAWPDMTKREVACRLVDEIAKTIKRVNL